MTRVDRQRIRETGTFSLLLITLAGCASRGDVRDRVRELEAMQEQVERLGQRVQALRVEIDDEAGLLERRELEVAAAREQALLAADGSRGAVEKVAGHLLGETVYWVEGLRFESGTAELTEVGRSLLDQLASRLRIEDAGYYLEVRAGSSDPASVRDLDRARIEAVRRYLHLASGLPLHAVSTLAAPGASARQHAGATAGAARAGAADPTAATATLAGEGQPDDLLEPAAVEERIAVVVVRPFPRP